MGKQRSITDDEIALIKAMIQRGMEKTQIQAYFTHPGRPVNFGRITNIEKNEYGPDVRAATEPELSRFLETWHERRGRTIQDVIHSAFDPQNLPASSPERLASLFTKTSDGTWIVRNHETDDLECKKAFHSNGKLLKAINALANNRGGHILFGVVEPDCRLVGLADRRFLDLDPSEVARKIRSYMEPMPRIEIGHAEIGKCLLGAIYVHREVDGPVIATRDDENFKEGTIYYRYVGESRPIRPAEFRKILNERDKRARQESLENITRVIELGNRASVIEREQIEPHSTKIVREGVNDADVLRNFVLQEKVAYPLAYVLRSANTAKKWLPVFYFAEMSGLDMPGILAETASHETSHIASRVALVDRLTRRKTARSKATGRVLGLLRTLRNGKFKKPETSTEAVYLAQALSALGDSSLPVLVVLDALKSCIEAVKGDAAGKPSSWSYIHRAAARIDEMYFGQADMWRQAA